jgi:hypothetical protein
MSLYRVYFKVTWHDRDLLGSYELVAAGSPKEARMIARERIRQLFPDLNPRKLSIRTSMKRWVD